jgi:hypothetical protein
VNPLKWAGSNIYWDGTQLTFAPAGTPLSDPRTKYSGVYFQWGSLVGISPAGDDPLGILRPPYEATVPLYEPTYDPATGANSWAINDSHNAGETGFQEIPSFQGIDFDDAYRGTNKDTFGLLDEEDSDRTKDEYYANQRGDICRYLGETATAPYNHLKGYRMPTLDEFMNGVIDGEPTITYNATDYVSGTPIHNRWTATSTWPARPTITATDGTQQVSHGAYNGLSTFFCASEYRMEGGSLNFESNGGYYWTGSAAAGKNTAFRVLVDQADLLAPNNFPTNVFLCYARAVRCVKDE